MKAKASAKLTIDLIPAEDREIDIYYWIKKFNESRTKKKSIDKDAMDWTYV